MKPDTKPAFLYFVPVYDSQANEWLTVQIVGDDGPCEVVGRWLTEAAAVEDCRRWTELEGSVA